MDNDVEITGFDGEGLNWVYCRAAWKIGIKNYKPQNGLALLDCLELHRATDETFILLRGVCYILTAREDSGSADVGLSLNAVPMKPDTVYTISKGVWHTTVTKPGVKLILIEAGDTSEKNSAMLKLSPDQVKAVHSAIKAAGFTGQ